MIVYYQQLVMLVVGFRLSPCNMIAATSIAGRIKHEDDK